MTATAPSASALEIVPPFEMVEDYFHGDGPSIADMTHDQRLGFGEGIEQLRHWLDATLIQVLAYDADHPDPLPIAQCQSQPGEFLRDEWALALGWSFGMAHDRITTAQILVSKLPGTLAAVETRACPISRPFQKALRRAVLAIDPNDRHAQASKTRAVTARPVEDGMGLIQALVPGLDMATIMTAIQAVADTYQKDDPRSADQRRADALTDICAATLANAIPGVTCGTRQGRPITLEVNVGLSALLGHSGEPGELAGFGPLSADLIRELALSPGAKWRNLIVDDHSSTDDHSTTAAPPAPHRWRCEISSPPATAPAPCPAARDQREPAMLTTSWLGPTADLPAPTTSTPVPPPPQNEARGRLGHRTPRRRFLCLDRADRTRLRQTTDRTTPLTLPSEVVRAVPTPA